MICYMYTYETLVIIITSVIEQIAERLKVVVQICSGINRDEAWKIGTRFRECVPHPFFRSEPPIPDAPRRCSPASSSVKPLSAMKVSTLVSPRPVRSSPVKAATSEITWEGKWLQ